MSRWDITPYHCGMCQRGITPQMGIPSQYIDLTNSHSPARSLNRVATVPGYNFGNTKWTTSNWQTFQTPRQQHSNALSPEVANLLQTLGQNSPSKDKTKSPEVIELDIDHRGTVNWEYPT